MNTNTQLVPAIGTAEDVFTVSVEQERKSLNSNAIDTLEPTFSCGIAPDTPVEASIKRSPGNSDRDKQETNMNSFYDIRLNPVITGSPRDLCERELWRIQEAASEIVVVAASDSVDGLIQATLGMQPALSKESDSRITLLIRANSNPTETAASQLSPPTRNSSSFRRLQMLRALLDQGRLNVECRQIADDEDSSNSLSEFPQTQLLSDSQGILVRIGWEKAPLNGSGEENSAELAWSYGDPQKRAKRAWDAVERLRRRKSNEEEVKRECAIKDLLQSVEPATGLLEEPFDSEGDDLPVKLFDHQQQALDAWFDNGMHGIFEMCTGAGKTITALASVWRLTREFVAEERLLPLVLVTVPTRVLADQWCEEVQKMGFLAPVRAYNSFDQFFPELRDALESEEVEKPEFVVTTYMSFADHRIQRLLSRFQRRGRQLLWIADEAHNLSTSRLQACMRDRASLFPFRIALTATPEIEGRPDRSAFLQDFFRGVIAHYTLKDGIQDGVLCPYRYDPEPAYLNRDLGARYLELLHEIDATGQDDKVSIDLYRQKRDLVRKSGVQIEAFKAILKRLMDEGKDMRHTLVYCPPGFASKAEEDGVDESDEGVDEENEERLVDQVTRHLLANGFEAARILGGTSASDRERSLEDFRAGRIHAVCAIGCLDEGVDIPSIKRAIVLYSVDREKQFIQRRGRILRQSRDHSEKIAEIIDVVVLPHGSHLAPGQSEALLSKEMRRYQTFAVLAQNKDDAERQITTALQCAVENTED